MKDDKLTNLLREKLGNYEGKTSPSDWEVISKHLNKKKRRKAIPLFWICSAAGVAAAILLFVLIQSPTNNLQQPKIAQVENKNEDKKPAIVDTTRIDANKKDNENLNSEQKNIEKKNIKIQQHQYKKQNFIAENKQAESNSNNIETHEVDNVLPQNATENKSFIADNNIDTKQQNKENAAIANDTAKQETHKTLNNNNDEIYWADAEKIADKYKKQNNSESKWALALATSTSMQTAKSDYTTKTYLYSNSHADNFTRSVATTQRESIMSQSPFTNTNEIDLKHKQPITFGLRIKKNIGKRLIVKTGISYTYFLSDFSSQDIEIEQKLHYIGIPIGLEYEFLQYKNFKAYASAEFAAEKNISAKYTESAITSLGKTYSVSNPHSVKGIQFSATAGIGVSYNFINNFGVYVEPNIVHYIKDKNQPESFRTEKKVNFGLGIGLKYNF